MSLSHDDFKAYARRYVEIHDEIAAASRQLRELRKQNGVIAPIILSHMKVNGIDVCDVEGMGGTLAKRESTRTETLKKEHILEELVALVHDTAKAQEILDRMMAKRKTEKNFALSRKR